MNSERFWSLVHACEWPRVVNASREVVREVTDKAKYETLPSLILDRVEGTEFHGVMAQKLRDLERATKEADVSLRVSDDAWDDILCHVIGLGKDEFQACLDEPRLIKNHATSYMESFRYCVPFGEEWDPAIAKENQKRAIKSDAAWDRWTQILHKTEVHAEAKRLVLGLVDRMAEQAGVTDVSTKQRTAVALRILLRAIEDLSEAENIGFGCPLLVKD